MYKDDIDLTQAAVHNSPQDIASWPITTEITSVTMRSRGESNPGFALEFDAKSREDWKYDTTPDDKTDNDNFQYTVWLFIKINGRWHGAGFIDMWMGRPSTGAPLLTDYFEWVYLNQWGEELQGYVPQVGDDIALMVSAGHARFQQGVTSVRERSNVVVIPLMGSGYIDTRDSAQLPPTDTNPPIGTAIDMPKLVEELKVALYTATQLLDNIQEMLDHPPTYVGEVAGYKIVLKPTVDV